MYNLETVIWGTFRIGDILTIENCKCSKVSALKDGDVPYIGATANNNGVLRFVERKESLITKGNCIVFICDGEGSIGLSIYKSEDFIGTTTVKVGRSKHLNKYTAMFITTVADTVRGKYNFGYKRNEKNLKRETINLPITTDGVPDWSFMEEYMKQVERQLLKPTIDKLCKRLITNELLGGVNRFTLIGKHSTLQRYSLKFSVVSVLKKQTTKLEILPMYHQHHSTMGLMASSAMMAA